MTSQDDLEKAFLEGVDAAWWKSQEGDNAEYSMFGHDTDKGFKELQDELLKDWKAGL